MILQVEGVCSQTEFLLRKAINLNLDTIVVFNKLDRLFVDLKQTTAEAFAHLRRLMEQVRCPGPTNVCFN